MFVFFDYQLNMPGTPGVNGVGLGQGDNVTANPKMVLEGAMCKSYSGDTALFPVIVCFYYLIYFFQHLRPFSFFFFLFFFALFFLFILLNIIFLSFTPLNSRLYSPTFFFFKLNFYFHWFLSSLQCFFPILFTGVTVFSPF